RSLLTSPSGSATAPPVEGQHQSERGRRMQPLTHHIGISVSQFTLALAVQNLACGFLQPVAGALSMAWRIGVALGAGRRHHPGGGRVDQAGAAAAAENGIAESPLIF